MIPIIISICLIVISLVAIFFIIYKKLSVIASIDVDNLPHEKESEVKEKILKDRFKRNLEELKRRTHIVMTPVYFINKKAGKLFEASYKNLVKLQKLFQHKRPLKDLGEKKLIAQTEIDHAVNQAVSRDIMINDEPSRTDKFLEEEKKYIEMIKLDSANEAAYEGLSDLYLEYREPEKAEEIIKFLIKLKKEKMAYFDEAQQEVINKDIAQDYVNLGKIYQTLDDKTKALYYFKKASEINPKNPKYLDHLIEAYILLEKKLAAEKVLEYLKRVNPENNKIEEFELRLKKLSY